MPRKKKVAAIEAPVSTPVPEIPQTETLKIENIVAVDDTSVLDRKNKIIFTLGSLFAFIIIITTVVFAFVYYKNPPKKDNSEIKVIVEPAKTVSNEVKVKFNKSEWNLEVLNGSGVAGAASKAAEKLIVGGFKVIRTGNADNSDYTLTEVLITKAKLDQGDELINELKSIFPTASLSGELNDSTASARIILGK